MEWQSAISNQGGLKEEKRGYTELRRIRID